MKDPQVFTRNLDRFAFYFIYFNILIASFLLIYFPKALSRFLSEDFIAETSGAVFLLLTGIILLLSAKELYKEGKASKSLIWWQFTMILGAGVLFILAFGEEISWGQRIFEINTPEFFSRVNRQNEMNLHNFDTRLFNNAVETIVLLMILVPTIWMHRGKNHLFGFILPSYWLILCLQLTAAYVVYNYTKTQDYITYLVLIYFFIVQIRLKDKGKFFGVVATIALVVFVGIVNVSFKKSFQTNGPREFREYLLSFICLIYALNIYIDVKYSGLIKKQAVGNSPEVI